jgi:phosphatidylglycerol:prolipoprotein diacylglycerol transferase
VGGVAAGVVVARRLGVPIWPALDAAAPGMLVGQAVGRIGCFINGDAWGAPNTACPWCGSVVYSHPNDLLPRDLLGIPTYPYPLYEILAVLVLLGLLWLARDRLGRAGLTFLLTAVGYAVIRFSLTCFRQETVVAFGLQEAQLVALATGLAALALLARRSVGKDRPRSVAS